MPVINGRYYMNPQYGMAVELDRLQNPPEDDQVSSWFDQFLGFVSAGTDSDTNGATEGVSDDIVQGVPGGAGPGNLIARNQENQDVSQDQPQRSPDLNNGQSPPAKGEGSAANIRRRAAIAAAAT